MNVSAVSSIARSGMNAAQQHLDTAAHNIANEATDGFRRQSVTQRELPGGGVTTTVEQAQTIGHDLPTDIVQQMSSSYTFEANLRTIRTQQDMLGTLLDMKA
ncbi:MAG: flagellar basal body rod protein [Burkholderiales bacterium]|nr:flagellar basal body rod protein [Burkholderiales bacterium]